MENSHNIGPNESGATGENLVRRHISQDSTAKGTGLVYRDGRGTAEGKAALMRLKRGQSVHDFLSEKALVGLYFEQLKLFNHIYQKPMASDFILLTPSGPVWWEVKYQSSSGSVDEKYVYTAVSMITAARDFPDLRLALSLTGGGARPAAQDWLKNLEANRCPVCRNLSHHGTLAALTSDNEILKFASKLKKELETDQPESELFKLAQG